MIFPFPYGATHVKVEKKSYSSSDAPAFFPRVTDLRSILGSSRIKVDKALTARKENINPCPTERKPNQISQV